MGALILLYFAIGMIYCAIKADYIMSSRLDELKRILNTASSKWMKYTALITAALDVIVFWPKFLLEDLMK